MGARRIEGSRTYWPLDPSVTFLNHGSFGACPIPVLEEQQRWRARMETQPVAFLDRELSGLLDEARARVGAFLGADPAGVAFVPNATAATSAILRSIDLHPDDEVLITDHAYPAVANAVRVRCAEVGARVVVAPIPVPLPASPAIAETVLAAVTPRTRLLIVDHLTSATAAVFPVAQIVTAARARGVWVHVDAAHAPGMLPVAVDALGADSWTGNFHKWVCAPKGAAALVVRDEHRARVRPTVTSHAYLESFHDRFDWTGTADPTPWLTVPAAIAFCGSFGWDDLRDRNHALALDARARIADTLGTPRLIDDDQMGWMALVALPAGLATTRDEARALQAALYERARVEVPIVPWPDGGFLRISVHAYTTPDDIGRLAEALPPLLTG